jgi:hypothetical protein
MITQSIQTKAAVTVAEMARMVRLSRARFYQLQNAGVFPSPVYDVSTRRPFYDESAQEVCLEVRRRNCGINGRAVLFYSRRGGEQSSTNKRKKASKPKPNKQHAVILDAVRSLGLAAVTTDQIGQAINELFPRGVDGVDQSEVIRSVFVHIQRQNCSDNVG